MYDSCGLCSLPFVSLFRSYSVYHRSYYTHSIYGPCTSNSFVPTYLFNSACAALSSSALLGCSNPCATKKGLALVGSAAWERWARLGAEPSPGVASWGLLDFAGWGLWELEGSVLVQTVCYRHCGSA
jgi:hypothetical protein